MRQLRLILLILSTHLLIQLDLSGQVSITGPNCVIPGQEYQYILQASTNNNNVEQELCVTGGKIVGSNNSCIKGQSLGLVKISWDINRQSGKVELKSGTSVASIDVSITKLLDPGKISSAATQTISYNTSPAAVNCTAASGGSCSPAFTYQWQRSSNALKWEDIAGAQGQGLASGTRLTETTYFRRKVTLANSGSVEYSDPVTVIVNPISQ